MAQGISVALPLFYNKQDGPFRLNKSIEDSVKQNFKNLILTAKGERIMDPDFGAGVYSFLFENYSASTSISLREEINSQTRKYMPFLDIREVNIAQSDTDPNKFHIYIEYFIESLNVLNELSFVITR